MGNCFGAPKEKKDSELKRVFDQFDLDGDGYIDENELKCAMDNLGQNPSENDIRTMFKAADANNDERISFEEFAAIANSVFR